MTTNLTIGADDWTALGAAPAEVDFQFRPVNIDVSSGRVLSADPWTVTTNASGVATTTIPDAVTGNGLLIKSNLRGFGSVTVASYPTGAISLVQLLGYAVDPDTLAPAVAPDAWWVALDAAVIGGGGGGGAVDSVNGKTGTVVLVPGDIAEAATRKWMTDVERTKLAGIATAATANATDAALRDRATHTGTQTSASISDFTEAAQDAVAAMLAQGTNVTLTYNDVANTLTIASAAGGGGIDAETARDTLGAALIGIGNITVTVNDALDTITISTTATANSTDAALRDRSTHTGTQTADTVVDGTTNKAYTATEKTKLAGIATGATANQSDATTNAAIALKADAAVAVSAQTANYTLVLADASKAVEVTSASSVVVTVPLNSTVAFPVGTVIEIDRLGAGSVTIAATGGVTLRYASSSLALRAQYSAATIRKQATDTWLVTGDLT